MQIEIKFIGDTEDIKDTLLFGLIAKAVSEFTIAQSNSVIASAEKEEEEPAVEEPVKPKRNRKKAEKKEEDTTPEVEAPAEETPAEETPAEETTAEETPAVEEPSDDLPFTPEVEETPAPVVEEKAPVVDAEYWRAALREKRVELGVDSTDERNREFLDWIRTTSETFGDRTPSHLPADKLAGFVGYFKQLKWSKEQGFHVPSVF